MYPMMSDTQVIDIAMGAIMFALKLAGPPLAAALVVGLVVSLLQAVFQVQDQSLTMVPKMAAVAVVLVISGPFMLSATVEYVNDLYSHIPAWVAAED